MGDEVEAGVQVEEVPQANGKCLIRRLDLLRIDNYISYFSRMQSYIKKGVVRVMSPLGEGSIPIPSSTT